jgi:hypothetical protein
MKILFFATAAALSLGIGSAYAGDGKGPAGGYVYPGSIYAGVQTPLQKTPMAATAQNGRTTHVYVTRSNQGTWLFAPNQNQGGSN